MEMFQGWNPLRYLLELLPCCPLERRIRQLPLVVGGLRIDPKSGESKKKSFLLRIATILLTRKLD